MKQLVALVMIAFLAPTTAALAENPCKADKAKFCKEVQDSGGDVKDCLKKHADELSAACKERFAKKKGGQESKASAETPTAPAPSDGAAPGSAETQAQ
jgi:hypothetical protein